MPRRSAGILLYKTTAAGTLLLLAHPGGPFWARKDDGAWSIPKGEYESGDDVMDVARREFAEETGSAITADLLPLGEFRQAGGKLVTAFAAEGDFDPATLRSNDFSMEWPPKSGRMQTFPEVDRAGWFSPEEALNKILPSQRPVIEALMQYLSSRSRSFKPD
jgi:predicted NUDIX family NTP pyrophosphohydrolase